MKFYIRELRERAGLTQAELAAQAGVSSVTISQWETGGHSMRQSTRDHLAAVLGVAEHELLGYDLPPTRDLSPPHRHLSRRLPSLTSEQAAALAALVDRDDELIWALLDAALKSDERGLRMLLGAATAK